MKKINSISEPSEATACVDGSMLESKTNSVMDALNAATKESNKLYSKMTKMEKRVALAKDVLKHIQSKKYIAEAGTYVEIKNTMSNYYDTINKLEMLKPEVVCNVCAIGSLFMAKVQRNRSNKKFQYNVDNMFHELSSAFTDAELRRLEYVFEGEDCTPGMHKKGRYTDIDGFIFHKKFETDESRLTAIMHNIIENKGKFIFNDLTI